MSETNKPRMLPKKIYLKDASFESPASPAVFLDADLKPDIDLNLNVDYQPVDDSGVYFDVVLQVTATAKQGDTAVFIAELHQAGVFEIYADDEEHKEIMLQVGCANMLLPFAREELASLVTKGGFPQVLINPINFETIYRKQKEAQAEKAVPQDAH